MKHIFRYIFLIVVFFSSCSGLGENKLIGNYYLTKLDYSNKELSLSYKLESSGDFIGVVNPTVFAVGYNNDFIIIKQHPSKFGEALDKSVVNYYIVPLKVKIHNAPDENKIGPLSQDEFLQKREELKIPEELSFTKIFKELQ